MNLAGDDPVDPTSLGETVVLTEHGIKAKVASYFVQGNLTNTVITVPLPANTLITEHHVANDQETGADKWLDLTCVSVAPSAASPSAAMSQLAMSQLDQSSSSAAMSQLDQSLILERMIRNEVIEEINKEYKSVRGKQKKERNLRRVRLAMCGKFYKDHLALQAMPSWFKKGGACN